MPFRYVRRQLGDPGKNLFIFNFQRLILSCTVIFYYRKLKTRMDKTDFHHDK